MSHLSWITSEIVLDDAISSAAVEHVVENPTVQVSLVHEYVHFLQLMTSVGGIRLLADLVDLGIRGALLLSGTIRLGDVVQGYRRILPLLEGLEPFAWRAHPGVEERRNETMDELHVLLDPIAHPYVGQARPWSVVRQVIDYRTFDEPLWGFVVSGDAGPEFRPFSVGFLAEAMARRLDRWFVARVAPEHAWQPGRVETEFYNGLLHLVSRPEYEEPLAGASREEIVVVIAALALATPSPDLATKLMLDRLRDPIDGGPLVANVARTLRELLVRRRLHHADHYNEAISDVMWGAASIMDRTEYLEIHQRLVQVHHAANRILDNPTMFVRPTLEWADVKGWMAWFPPPPIVMGDGSRAATVDGQRCEPFCATFLSLVERKLLASPAVGG